MEPGNIKITTLLLSFVVLFLAESAANVVVSMNLLSPIITLGITRFVEAMLLLVVVILRGDGFIAIGLARHQIFAGIKKGLIWSLVFGAIVSVAVGILYTSGINPLNIIKVRLPDRTLELIYFYFTGSLLAPIAEEIFFRGILYGFLRRWGIAAAISLSTLLFVLPHIAETSLPVTQIVGGVVFARGSNSWSALYCSSLALSAPDGFGDVFVFVPVPI